MGNSNSGRYTDGRDLFGVGAWEAHVHRAWPMVQETVARSFGAPGIGVEAASPARPRVAIPLRTVLKGSEWAADLEATAKATGYDEAEVALLVAASHWGDAVAARQEAARRARLGAEVERRAVAALRRGLAAERRAPTRATRLMIHTRVLEALRGLEPGSTPEREEWEEWCATGRGRAFLGAALAAGVSRRERRLPTM